MRRRIWILLVFAAILGMLIFINAQPSFPDPDSFYHAKMALLIRDHGFLHQLPWLHDTILATTYVDYHLGYHLLLIPFVTFFDPLVGMKVSAVLFGLVAFYALYRFLKSLAAPRPELIVLVAALSTSFLQRMSLPRAPALSVAILLVCVYALIHKKRWLIFISTFTYVWFYYGWPLLFLILPALFVADVMTSHLLEPKPFKATMISAWKNLRPSAVVLVGGIIAGLVINPYFPTNIIAISRDVFKLAIVNYQHVIPVGQEWYPTTVVDLLRNCPLLVTVFALSVALLLPAAAYQSAMPSRKKLYPVFVFLLLASGFFILTLKSSRFVEYEVPFFLLTIGALLTFSLPFIENELIPSIKILIKRQRALSILVLIFLSLGLFLFAYNTVQGARPGRDYFQAAQYSPATDWIKVHVPKDEIIFHNGWDFSLVLFYLDDSHRYLVGLDPTYMYDAFRDQYIEWMALCNGSDTDVQKIITDFQSHTVVIDTRVQGDLEKNLQASGLFEEVVFGKWVHVYSAK